MQINVSDEIAKQLQATAARQNKTVDAVVEELLRENLPKRKGATLADMAKHALEGNLSSEHPVDTAANSREILNTEFADYLKRRMDSDE